MEIIFKPDQFIFLLSEWFISPIKKECKCFNSEVPVDIHISHCELTINRHKHVFRPTEWNLMGFYRDLNKITLSAAEPVMSLTNDKLRHGDWSVRSNVTIELPTSIRQNSSEPGYQIGT